ncbi:unnamed protein product [Schistosoma turkestanicum]|nr:unnamed protein product [Schistosoma turkestanicum]
MTTTDSISGLYALCAFNLNSVDQNLNIDHLIKLKQSNNAHNGLFRMIWRDNNNNNNNEINSSSTYYSFYKYTSKWSVDIVPSSKMTREIMKTSKTCPSESLPDYYSQFATLHPLVGTRVWSLNMIHILENQTTPTTTNEHTLLLLKQPGKALNIFTMNDFINETREIPIDFIVQWANSIHDNDMIYIATNKKIIFTIETGIKLKQQIVYSQNFKHQFNSNILNTINYFIKTNENKKFQIMDKFKIIIDNNYTIQSLYKCDFSSILSVNMMLNDHSTITYTKNDLNRNKFAQNKMIPFHPVKIVCDAYFSCKNCQFTNQQHFCKWNDNKHICLLNDSSHSQLKSMDSSLYNFCYNEYDDDDEKSYIDQSKQYHRLRGLSDNKLNNNKNLSRRKFKNMKLPNDNDDDLNFMLTHHQQSTPSMFNMKTLKSDKYITAINQNHSSNSSNETNIIYYHHTTLHHHIFNCIVILSILIICISLSMICGYVIGNRNYFKQYNKVKRLLLRNQSNYHHHHHHDRSSPSSSASASASASSFSATTSHDHQHPHTIDMFNDDQCDLFHFNCNAYQYHQQHHQHHHHHHRHHHDDDKNFGQSTSNNEQQRLEKHINKNENPNSNNNNNNNNNSINNDNKKRNLMNSQYHNNKTSNLITTFNHKNNNHNSSSRNNEMESISENLFKKHYYTTTMHDCFYHHYNQSNETPNEILSNLYDPIENQQPSSKTTMNNIIQLYCTTIDKHRNSSLDYYYRKLKPMKKINSLITTSTTTTSTTTMNMKSNNLPQNKTSISSFTSTVCLSSLQQTSTVTTTVTSTTIIVPTMNTFSSSSTTTTTTNTNHIIMPHFATDPYYYYCCTPTTYSSRLCQQFQSSLRFKSSDDQLQTNIISSYPNEYYYYTSKAIRSSERPPVQHRNHYNYVNSMNRLRTTNNHDDNGDDEIIS